MCFEEKHSLISKWGLKDQCTCVYMHMFEISVYTHTHRVVRESVCTHRIHTRLCLCCLQEIGSLRNLKFLEASENQIMFLPLSVSSLVSLQDLHLSDNLLTLLPDTIGELPPPSLSLSHTHTHTHTHTLCR